MEFTAVIRKGEKFFVALCPELDVVSQGRTEKEAMINLKEAVELYLEEMGVPEGSSSKDATITRFTINGEAA